MSGEELRARLEEIKSRKDSIDSIDQRGYIELVYIQRELARKEKIEDSEYQMMLDNIEQQNDPEALEQFLRDHMSQSEYEKQREETERLRAEIDAKMNDAQNRNFDFERNETELQVRANRLRGELRLIQDYYRANDMTVMRNVNLDTMSDEEIVVLYDQISSGISAERLEEMKNYKVRNRMNNRTSTGGNSTGNNGGNENPNPTGGTGDEPPVPKKDEIEKRIVKFQEDIDRMKDHLNRIKASLVLDDTNDLDVTDAIRGLDDELKGLDDEAKQLIDDIDEFKLKYENADFSLDYKQIKSELQELKNRLKNLKISQLAKWNARVDETNKLIDELKGLTDLDPEVQAMVDALSRLDRCEKNINQWTAMGYLKDIDYNKLVEINKRIAEINAKRGNGKTPPLEITVDLESDMVAIENAILHIESEIEAEMTLEDVERLRQDIVVVADNINSFRVKLENNKDKITEEEYNNYLERINDAEYNLADLNTKLNNVKIIDGKKVEPVKNNDYEELMRKLNTLQLEVNNLDFLIESLYSKVVEDALSVFETNLDTLSGRLSDLEDEINQKRNDGKLDENQYNNLMTKVSEIRNTIDRARGKLKDPKMIRDVDVFAFLNGRIDGVEAALDNLETQVDALEKPVKDRNVRKQIDAIIKKLEDEIKDIDQQLEKYKDEDPVKYQATKERLNNVKDRLDKVSKKYRAKCPLLVRAVKSAKDFLKKHKKAALIIAGLAAIALVHATVGPMLIPAIMHGNAMIGTAAPSLAGYTDFTNNILGGLIGATKTAKGGWLLANGVRIGANLSSTSLLKGLAISGVGTAALVTPIVVSIKKLVEKMKKSELKKKLEEENDKNAKKIERKKKEKDDKNKSDKKKTKRADKMAIDYLAKLFKQYSKLKNEMSLDEFCEKNELSDEEKAILQYLESQSKENVENLNNSSRRGR